MRSILKKQHSRVSLSVLAFSGLISVMLFDTQKLYLGRISAFIVCSAIIIASIIESYNARVKYSINPYSLLIVAFIFVNLFMMLIYQVETNIMSLASIALLGLVSIVMSSREYTNAEIAFLDNAIVVSTLIYTLWFLLTAKYYGFSIVRRTLYVFGNALDPNFFGCALVCGALITFDRLIKRRHYWFVNLTILLMITSAIIATASRTAFISLTLVLSIRTLVILYNTRGFLRRIAIIALALIIILALGLTIDRMAPSNITRLMELDIRSGVGGRTKLWQRAIAFWFQKPLLGIGFGASYNLSLPISSTNMVTHNIFLKLLAETGIIGLTLFLLFLNTILRSNSRIDVMRLLVILTAFIPSLTLDVLDSKVFWVVICYSAILGRKFLTESLVAK